MRKLKNKIRQLLGNKKNSGDSEFQSKVFDAEWYTQMYPEVAGSNLNPLLHYYEIGADKGYDPSPFFSTNWYNKKYQDVALAGMNPLIHYEKYGYKESRWPSAEFDPDFYNSNYLKDGSAENPLVHYIHFGHRNGHITQMRILQADQASKLQTFAVASNLHGRAHLSGDFSPLTATLSYLKDLESACVTKLPIFSAIEEEWKRESNFPSRLNFACIEECEIIPGSAMLFPKEGCVVNEEIARLLGKADGSSLVKNWQTTVVNKNRVTVQCLNVLTPVVREGIHLFKEYEQNFFHFVLELGVKLSFIEDNLNIASSVPLLVSDDLPDSIYQIIERLKASDRPVLRLKRNALYRVNKLYYFSDIAQIVDCYHREPTDEDCFFPRTQVLKLVEKLKADVVNENPKERKIYLKRGSTYRALTNETSIIDVLLKEGFEVVDTNSLSFQAQVDLFHTASTIIGPTGAAFTNLLWCRKRTNVLILYPRHPFSNTSFWNRIAEIKGLNLAFLNGRRTGKVTGEHSMHDDFAIDPDELIKQLELM
ncbi:glycosyltransferase family 61 protein [Ruegeria atlantica]|uniref:Capsular polysaccharide biosynthesis protein n=1 Tax=Ruegeria atlantica TaxID=81569 RepID=A0A0N7LR50_9RHOB|nr:glycosyltransferase family 61 protein [Ruegeria atlantica]CUH49836.1 Capsular polysaccharide biosynthesis protein [Ruegeria atlantica]